jgi:hypothetical protein
MRGPRNFQGEKQALSRCGTKINARGLGCPSYGKYSEPSSGSLLEAGSSIYWYTYEPFDIDITYTASSEQ